MSKYQLLANQEPLVTIDQFRGTYKDVGIAQHYADKGEKFLTERGALPLTFMSPALFNINMVVGWLTWSGCITEKYGNLINVSETHREGLEDIVERLGSGLRANSDGNVSFTDNGRYYSRLFSLLGVHVSNGTRKAPDGKVNHVIELPKYLNFFTSKYNEFRGDEKKIAVKCLADQCKILLFSRLIPDGNRYILPLIANNDIANGEDNVKQLATNVLNMFNRVYPMIGLNKASIKIDFHKLRKNYYSRIIFDFENVISAIKHYGLFDINIKKQYHPLNKKASARIA